MQKHADKNKAKSFEFPMIVLEEDDNKSKDTVLKGIKDVFSAIDLPFMDEIVDGSKHTLIFSHTDGDVIVEVEASYDSDVRLIKLSANYGVAPQHEKITELVNLLNVGFTHPRIMIVPNSGDIVIDIGIIITTWFNTREIYINLVMLLVCGKGYQDAAEQLMSSNETPMSIMDRVWKAEQKFQDAINAIKMKRK